MNVSVLYDVPQIQKEIVEVTQYAPQERFSGRIGII